MIHLIARVMGIGIETADMLVNEILSRHLRDTKAVARYAGLTGSPDESGKRRREKGLARAGNARVRRGMIQLAWRFLRFQKDSVLAQWFRARAADGRSGTRKTMIVALARKLLIAPWRMATTGEIVDRFVEPLKSLGQNLNGRFGGVRKRRVTFGQLKQLVDAANSLGGDNAEFRKMAAKRVDAHGPLLDQQFTRLVQHQRGLLLRALDRNEAHSRSRHRFAAGIGVDRVVTPGFNALKFFAWMDESKPTWYTVTEAAHQMTSNPLHGVRKPGSVGLAAGPEVAIMDENGHLLEAGEVGEIGIRGENVTAGYENNPKANAEAIVNGWLRTGDQGVKDADGYISLTGRLKEIINRGGEKVSPREVDEALMDHPAVLQVVTFAVPHDKLGEDIAAAVVLREGATATEGELRSFLSERLAAFKTPRKILFLAEIPKGATGKLQRIGLAEKLGLC